MRLSTPRRCTTGSSGAAAADFSAPWIALTLSPMRWKARSSWRRSLGVPPPPPSWAARLALKPGPPSRAPRRRKTCHSCACFLTLASGTPSTCMQTRRPSHPSHGKQLGGSRVIARARFASRHHLEPGVLRGSRKRRIALWYNGAHYDLLAGDFTKLDFQVIDGARIGRRGAARENGQEAAGYGDRYQAALLQFLREEHDEVERAMELVRAAGPAPRALSHASRPQSPSLPCGGLPRRRSHPVLLPRGKSGAAGRIPFRAATFVQHLADASLK